MNQFETIKAAVPLRQAAETYGLRVLRNGMTCCPFHEDRHPSMKLNKDYFFCFGCGASGDVIDFTARLFGLSPYAAAQKLETDFGIDAETKLLPFPNHAEPSSPRQSGDGWDLPASQDDTAAARCKDAADIPAKRKCRAAPYPGLALHGSWESPIVLAVWD